MSIIYVITTVLLIISFMLLYKKEEKLNIVLWLASTICLVICYNIFLSVILYFMNLKTTLTTLSLINVFTITFLGLKIYKDKRIQKYTINKIDVISVIIILLLVVVVFIKQYGIPINIKNSITDASTHYYMADDFYKYSMLLLNESSDILELFDDEVYFPGAYINTGILFKIFSPIMSETNFYKLYIIFDVSMWCLAGLLIYVLLANNSKNKILPLIFSLIYMMGYPLNSLLSGFSYLQIGLNIIICLLIIIKQEINQAYKYILMFLLNFGLVFSYYYFAPVVFLAIFLQIVQDNKNRNEKIHSTVFLFVLPQLFGIMYFFIFQIVFNGINPFDKYLNVINTVGMIYINFITNILIFIILDIWYIIHNIKLKKQNLIIKMLVLTVVFLIILFLGMKIGKVSEYYCFKVYYMLWIYVIVVAFNSINVLIEKNKILTYSFIGIYCCCIFMSVILNNNFIFFDIYQKNIKEIMSDFSIITDKELEIIRYYNENINSRYESNTYMYPLNWHAKELWIYSLTKNIFLYINSRYGENEINIQQFLESEEDYCIVLKKEHEEIFRDLKGNQEFNIIYQNEAGAILQKNKK